MLFRSEFSSAYRMQILGVVALVALGGAWLFSKPIGKRLLDRVVLTVPVFRAVAINANAARFSRTLAILLRAGLPLSEIMEMVVRTTDNTILRGKTDTVRRALLDGEGLSGPMARVACYPPLLVQMVAVGEETGALDDLMSEIADMYQREVEYDLKSIASQIEPVLVVSLGVMVLILALGVFLPIWDLGSAALGKK